MFKRLITSVFLFIVLFISFIFIANIWVVKSSNPSCYNSVKDIPHNKVGLVLGTSKYLKGGFINLYFKHRIDATVDLFKNKKIDYVLVSGDNSTHRYNEPKEFKKELIKNGIPADRIHLDYAGFRTYDSMIRANKVFQLDSVTVVSQKFHNQRAIYIGKKNGIEVIGFNAQDVNNRYGLKTQLREYLAKVLVIWDVATYRSPKFLGDPIKIDRKPDSVLAVNTSENLAIEKKYLIGKFNPEKDPNFTALLPPISNRKIYLHKKAAQAFINMRKAAKKEGVNLTIKSGARNFYYQKGIWERKWKKYASIKDPKKRALKILEYSSMPGTSRHHWGTDIDLNNFENSYFEKGKGLKEHQWLKKNAWKFGFHQVYTQNKDRPGYHFENWHWSYLPLANQYLEQYNKKISYSDISGFSGSEKAKEIGMIKNFVNGVDLEIPKE
jgi:vancomycin permeability regulator SanA/LAS superfamily LD-carboxypeptidase LdcB